MPATFTLAQRMLELDTNVTYITFVYALFNTPAGPRLYTTACMN
jgi:hypothetical protein